MTELTPEKIIANGKHADALMKDPLMLEAQKLTHMGIYDQWCRTQPSDVTTREKLWCQVMAVSSFFETLNKIRNAGIAEEQKQRAASAKK